MLAKRIPGRLSGLRATGRRSGRGCGSRPRSPVSAESGEEPHNVTDDEVCQLIVGLSRTRKACHLVSAGNWLGVWKKESTFFRWLGDIATERREIDKDYWNE